MCAVSSGNHAQAVALAARLCGTRAVILMPADAPALKRAATEGYGAEVVEYERYGEDREELVHELAAERGMVLVHPYDNPRVMAGQGTAGARAARRCRGARRAGGAGRRRRAHLRLRHRVRGPVAADARRRRRARGR